MTLVRRAGYGFLLGVDPTGGTSFTAIGSIVNEMKGPSTKVKTADITILSDVATKVLPVLVEGGELTFGIAYSPEDTATTTIVDLLVGLSATEPNWQITFPAGTGSGQHETFKGFVTGLSRNITRDGLVAADITVMVSGLPGYTS